jgi:hypothetical protein
MSLPAIDIYNDKAPKRRNNRTNKPTMQELRTALQTADAAYFTNARLAPMTRNDLINAARVRGVAVATTLQL